MNLPDEIPEDPAGPEDTTLDDLVGEIWGAGRKKRAPLAVRGKGKPAAAAPAEMVGAGAWILLTRIVCAILLSTGRENVTTHKIEALKKVREILGVGLKEAKDFVDQIILEQFQLGQLCDRARQAGLDSCGEAILAGGTQLSAFLAGAAVRVEAGYAAERIENENGQQNIMFGYTVGSAAGAAECDISGLVQAGARLIRLPEVLPEEREWLRGVRGLRSEGWFRLHAWIFWREGRADVALKPTATDFAVEFVRQIAIADIANMAQREQVILEVAREVGYGKSCIIEIPGLGRAYGVRPVTGYAWWNPDAQYRAQVAGGNGDTELVRGRMEYKIFGVNGWYVRD